MLRRLISTVAGVAFLCSWSHASTLHVHAYAGHDHAEHHHGPAAHDHDHAGDSPDPDPRAQLTGCDPAVHIVSVVFACAAAPRSPAIVAESVTPLVLTPDVLESGAAALTDLRAHGPPAVFRTSPRGPPACFSA